MSLSSLPRVAICVTTYKSKTYPYLKLAMDSIKNLNYSAALIDVILCCHQLDYREYKTEFGKDGVNVITPPEMEYSNARAMNLCVANASEDTKYFWILNDDVILTKHSLFNLVQSIGDTLMIASPIATCDQGRQFNLVMGVTVNNEFVPLRKNFYRLPELAHMTKEIMDAGPIYPPGFIYTDFLCTFAGFYPKSVLDKVGKFEEGFRHAGPDDIDISIRCQKLGFRCAFVLDSFVLHFGGATADGSVSVEDRIYNARFFKEKHGFHCPGITDETLAKLSEKDYQYADKKS